MSIRLIIPVDHHIGLPSILLPANALTVEMGHIVLCHLFLASSSGHRRQEEPPGMVTFLVTMPPISKDVLGRAFLDGLVKHLFSGDRSFRRDRSHQVKDSEDFLIFNHVIVVHNCVFLVYH